MNKAKNEAATVAKKKAEEKTNSAWEKPITVELENKNQTFANQNDAERSTKKTHGSNEEEDCKREIEETEDDNEKNEIATTTKSLSKLSHNLNIVQVGLRHN